MSSISCAGSDPSLLLQQVQAQNRSAMKPGGRQGFEAGIDAAAKAAGLDSTQVSQLHQDIRSAVQSALKADPSLKGQSVKEAVDGVLKKYGIDPSKLQSQRGAGKMRHHGGSKAPKSTTDPDDSDAPQNATDQAVATLLKGLPSGSLVNVAA
jgi:hypothetical protein